MIIEILLIRLFRLLIRLIVLVIEIIYKIVKKKVKIGLNFKSGLFIGILKLLNLKCVNFYMIIVVIIIFNIL